MLRPLARAGLLVMLASCSLLTACEEAAQDEGAAKSAVNTPRKNMVAAVASEKSTAALGLHFALTKTPTLNQGLPVDIVIVPHQGFSSVAVHFFGQDGVTLISGDSLGPVSEVTPEKPIKHQLVLMPVKEGIFMVNATVETIGSDGTLSRVYSIPILVSPPAAPAAGVPAPAPGPATPAPSTH
jgi:hypothetical protein